MEGRAGVYALAPSAAHPARHERTQIGTLHLVMSLEEAGPAGAGPAAAAASPAAADATARAAATLPAALPAALPEAAAELRPAAGRGEPADSDGLSAAPAPEVQHEEQQQASTQPPAAPAAGLSAAGPPPPAAALAACFPAAAPAPAAVGGIGGPEFEAAWELELWKREEEARWRGELQEREANRMVSAWVGAGAGEVQRGVCFAQLRCAARTTHRSFAQLRCLHNTPQFCPAALPAQHTAVLPSCAARTTHRSFAQLRCLHNTPQFCPAALPAQHTAPALWPAADASSRCQRGVCFAQLRCLHNTPQFCPAALPAQHTAVLPSCAACTTHRTCPLASRRRSHPLALRPSLGCLQAALEEAWRRREAEREGEAATLRSEYAALEARARQVRAARVCWASMHGPGRCALLLPDAAYSCTSSQDSYSTNVAKCIAAVHLPSFNPCPCRGGPVVQGWCGNLQGRLCRCTSIDRRAGAGCSGRAGDAGGGGGGGRGAAAAGA